MDHPDLALIRSAHAEPSARSPAMNALLERLEPAMHAAARGYARGGRLHGVAARDIVQAAWVRLTEKDWRRLRAFDPSQSRLEHYVALVTHSVAREMSRTLVGRARHVEMDALPTPARADGPSPERRAGDRELLLELAAHLKANLSPRNWLVFVLLFEDRRSPREVAELIGVERQTVFNITQTIREVATRFLERADGPEDG